MPERGNRLRAEDWLDLGLAGLVEKGAAGLTLESLCAKAGRTRGSFYHHFAAHDGFVAALLTRWRDRQTEALIRDVETIALAGARSARLHHLASGLDHRVDVAVRRFGAENETARAAVDAVDARRVAFIERLYREGAGLDAQAARTLAQVEYAMFVGWQMLWPRQQPPDMHGLRLLLQDLPGDALAEGRP